LVFAALALAATALILPWGSYLERFDAISDVLRSQADGTGLSVLGTPLLIPLTVVAAVIIGRERLMWWIVPAFWPYTQFYYSSLVIPAGMTLGALVAAVPIPGAAAIGLIVLAIEHVARWWRDRLRAADPLPIPAKVGRSPAE
jgi:hypothetical protein